MKFIEIQWLVSLLRVYDFHSNFYNIFRKSDHAVGVILSRTFVNARQVYKFRVLCRMRFRMFFNHLCKIFVFHLKISIKCNFLYNYAFFQYLKSHLNIIPNYPISSIT